MPSFLSVLSHLTQEGENFSIHFALFTMPRGTMIIRSKAFFLVEFGARLETTHSALPQRLMTAIAILLFSSRRCAVLCCRLARCCSHHPSETHIALGLSSMVILLFSSHGCVLLRRRNARCWRHHCRQQKHNSLGLAPPAFLPSSNCRCIPTPTYFCIKIESPWLHVYPL